jgi:hypothetical protein
MVVHALHVAGRKNQDPGFEVFSSEEIQAAVAFLSFLSLFQNIQDFHRNLLSALQAAEKDPYASLRSIASLQGEQVKA